MSPVVFITLLILCIIIVFILRDTKEASGKVVAYKTYEKDSDEWDTYEIEDYDVDRHYLSDIKNSDQKKYNE